MNKILKEFYNDIARKPQYWVFVLFFSYWTYGFSTMNNTISMDDLARDLYIGSGKVMLGATRWGTWLWHRIFNLMDFVPSVEKILCVVFLIIAGTLIGCLFYQEDYREKNVFPYTICTLLFITYPLITEIIEFSGANMIVAGNFCIVAGVILFQTVSREKVFINKALSGIFLSIVAASYETGLFVYIALVCILLFYRYCVLQKKMQKRCQWIIEGLEYAIPLVIAVVLRIIVGIAIIKILNLSYASNGATQIGWQLSISYVLQLIRGMFIKYVFTGLVYFPLFVFVISVLVFVSIALCLSLRQKRILPFLLGVIVLISLFSQVILQGTVTPYRNAHTLFVFVAFVGFLVSKMIMKKKKFVFRTVAFVLAMLCIYQSVLTNKLLALNNQRSNNETFIVRQLGYQLKKDYEDKPVVFVGNYEMGDWITSRIEVDENKIGSKIYMKLLPKQKYIETNVISVLDWGRIAFGNQNMMKAYFAYCGFDIQVIEPFSQEIYDAAYNFAVENKMRSFDIGDAGEYIVVCMGQL